MKYLNLTEYSYTKSAYARSAEDLISNAETQLIGQGIDFDSMVGTGHSGLLVLPILARHFDVPFFALRKPDIKHHNKLQPYGDGSIGKRWIFIDDVTVTHSTISFALESIDSITSDKGFSTEYVGTYLYEPMAKVPGEFIYPGWSKASLQAVELGDKVAYVPYFVYAKVTELINAYPGNDCQAIVEKVKVRYPGWDSKQVTMSARSILIN